MMIDGELLAVDYLTSQLDDLLTSLQGASE